MEKRLFLLDGMALVYRAHFAFINHPITTSQGMNTSAIYGFINTLLELLQNQKPSHLAVAFDTSEPTERHQLYPEYKAQREEMPEALSEALPWVEKALQAFHIPILKAPGYEADDIIGTLAKRAEKEGFTTYMVTPDKDFAQLVSPRIKMLKPSRQGTGSETLGPEEIAQNWGISKMEQVIDVLALWGDSSDNIPGVPGIGQKTAQKLIAKYHDVENLIAHADELTPKQGQKVAECAEQIALSKKLATILCDVPLEVGWDDLAIDPYDEGRLKELFIELEFNSLGKRLFGENFKAGRGHSEASENSETPDEGATLKTIKDTPHQYHLVQTEKELENLLSQLQTQKKFCFDVETSSLDPKTTDLLGIAFSWKEHEGYYLALSSENREKVLRELSPILTDPQVEKIGHNLKFDLSVLAWNGVNVSGPLFDTMVAHFLIDPGKKHTMDLLAETYLGYTPISITEIIGEKSRSTPQMSMFEASEKDIQQVAEYAAEDADVTWQLAQKLRALLTEKGQERVFYEIECPLIPVLVAMEKEGIAIEPSTLAEVSQKLAKKIDSLQKSIYADAGTEFNLNSPKQLGQVLFDILKLVDKPKKTKTGQYMTNEQVLTGLAPKHEIVQNILDYREATKLKNTYVDTLPHTIFEKTNRIHTTFHQTIAATGRLASTDPNLQNIPIRTEMGREIRRAFIADKPGTQLLSADYSQVELRIMAQLSDDKAMLESFHNSHDIHTATAAKVYGVAHEDVIPEMRRTAKMVNFGIIYGISAFGLSQRLGIPRGEAAKIISTYFEQYPGVKAYMDKSIEDCRKKGYAETITGRRRYLPDINSANATVRSGAERVAINMPIQGTAADMIKLAMIQIERELQKRDLQSHMLLQVHDELVFELADGEKEEVTELVIDKMRTALPLAVPIEVEVGVGENWLEAH